MQQSYVIPAANLAGLLEKIRQLNKRARRIKVPEIQTSQQHHHWEKQFKKYVGSISHKDPEEWNHTWVDESDYKKIGELISTQWTETGLTREWMTFEVIGETPKFDGWSLIGVLSPLECDDGTKVNLIRAVPGNEVPPEFRERIGDCDHCKTSRRRTETFVVKHDDGRAKVVGRNCLKDFLGHEDPHALSELATLLAILGEIMGDATDEDWCEGNGGGTESIWSLSFFLEWTASCIRHDGWLSRGAAKDLMQRATADWVLTCLCPPKPIDSETRRFIDERVPNEEDENVAAAAIEYAAQLEGKSDYEHNLQLLTRVGRVTRKESGIAASMIAAYQKDQVRRRELLRFKDEYVGVVGKRTEFEVICNRVIQTEPGQFGIKGIHLLQDTEGRPMVWFASGSTTWLDTGVRYRIKATVKDHTTYKERKQTVLSRVAIVEKLGDADASKS